MHMYLLFTEPNTADEFAIYVHAEGLHRRRGSILLLFLLSFLCFLFYVLILLVPNHKNTYI